MPSSYTPNNRLVKQATGENTNVWGDILNNGAFELIDFALDGTVTISASGATVLTTANGATDQARGRILNYTGLTAGTLTIPSLSKFYIVRAATADCVITNGPSSTTVTAGSVVMVATNGATIWPVVATDFANKRLTRVGTPTQNTDAATKKYVDDTAFSSITNLPGQAGSAGKFLSTDGANAGWEFTTAEATVSEIRAGTVDGKYISPADLASAEACLDLGNVSGTLTLDLTAAWYFRVRATGNLTLAVPPVLPDGFYYIQIEQDGTGNRTLAVNVAIKKPQVTPTLSTAANAIDGMAMRVRSGVLYLSALEKGFI